MMMSLFSGMFLLVNGYNIESIFNFIKRSKLLKLMFCYYAIHFPLKFYAYRYLIMLNLLKWISVEKKIIQIS